MSLGQRHTDGHNISIYLLLSTFTSQTLEGKHRHTDTNTHTSTHTQTYTQRHTTQTHTNAHTNTHINMHTHGYLLYTNHEPIITNVKNSSIVLSRNSHNFYPLFLFYSHIIT